jgi:hypothetical protein
MLIFAFGLFFSSAHAENQTTTMDKRTRLTFRFTGHACSEWLNEQGATALCTDYVNLPAEVRIVARGANHVWFDGVVSKVKDFTIDALNGGQIYLTGETTLFEIFDHQGNLLQEIAIGTGPSHPLIEGDLFGSLALKKVTYEFKIPKKNEDFYDEIVLFHDAVTWEEILAYAAEWEAFGVKTAMELPLINGLALKVPYYVMPDDLRDDPRVLVSEADQDLMLKEMLDSQGKSFIQPLDHEPKRNKHQCEYPWSILKLLEQPYDDDSCAPVDWLYAHSAPRVTQLALKNLKEAKLKIAFFDTGIDKKHKTLGRLVKGGLSIIEAKAGNNGKTKFKNGAPIDDNGHGTHVAGILAALLDNDHYWGRKADIELYSVKVLDNYATGKLSNVLMGLQWAIDQDIDIVNMSIGYRQDSPTIRRAIQEASKAGMIMVASAGNHSNYDDGSLLQGLADGGAADGGAADGGAADGGAADGGAADGGAADGGAADGGAADGGAADGGAADGGAADGGAADGGAADGGAADGGEINNLEAQPLPLHSVMYPARYPEVIAVGASDADGRLASFSNSGQEMDVMAPGTNIVSADITNGNEEEGLGLCSGTSMSTPYVTGAAALMLALDPTLDSEDIRKILVKTADNRSDATMGDLNLTAALDEVLVRLMGQDPGSLNRKEMKKIYRHKLKEKIRRGHDTLED